MSIRQNVFWIGETVEMTLGVINQNGSPSNTSGVKAFIRKPNGVLNELPIAVNGGVAALDIQADMPGTWKVRIESTGNPIVSVVEKRFEVAPSFVLNP